VVFIVQLLRDWTTLAATVGVLALLDTKVTFRGTSDQKMFD
jgi:hypothetical protein